MKKVLALVIAVVMCISIFAFNVHPFKTIAQTAVNENNISVMNSNVEPTVQSVNLEGINAAGIKQTDVTEYYKNQDSIANLLSTATPTAVGTTWAKTYGGDYFDWANSIQQTSDGGYIVAGTTLLLSGVPADSSNIGQIASFNITSINSSTVTENIDCLVIKLNSNGVVTWARTYDKNEYDWAESIQQTSDGGYILAGATGSFDSNTDCLVIKLDSNGVVSWAKTYDKNEYDWAESIQQTSDGGYILAVGPGVFGEWLIFFAAELTASPTTASINSSTPSEIFSDFLVIKLYADGTVDWAKTYGGDYFDWAKSIQQTSDGGYIVAGTTLFFSVEPDVSSVGQIASFDTTSIDSTVTANIDCLVIKLNSNGIVTWAKTYGGDYFDWAKSIQQTSDGGYILAGATGSFDSNTDFLVIKLYANGTVDWIKTYNKDEYDWAESIQQTSDGGYILAGGPGFFGEWLILPASPTTASINSSISKVFTPVYTPDFLVIKLHADGTVDWAKTYEGDYFDWAKSIQQTSDGGYIVAGTAFSSSGVPSDFPNVGQIASFDPTSIDSTTEVVYFPDFLIVKLDSNGEIGGSCNYLKDCSPTVESCELTVTDPTLSTTSIADLGAEADVITNSPTIQSDTICEGSVAIIATAGPGGSISPSGIVGVNYGGNKTFTITPDTGYMIGKILVDGSPVHFIHTSGDTYTFTNVTSDHTISASFIRKPIPTFTVTASVSVYGDYATVTPKEQTVQSGNLAKIIINPDAGYHITGVTDNDNTVPMSKLVENANGTYTYTILAVYENHKIIITLEKNKYIIKAKAGEGGTISPSGNVTVKYNSTESFTITPDSGYKIDKVIVDNKPITLAGQIYKFKNVKDDHTIEVTFVRTSVKTPLIITLQIDNPEITINGILKAIDEQESKPIIKNDRTLLPIRVLIESLDGHITWNEKTREVTINLNHHTIILTIDNNTAVVDGINMQIDPNNSKVTPIIINGRTYLPLRFIVEHLDGVVDWDNDTRTVTMYYWP